MMRKKVAATLFAMLLVGSIVAPFAGVAGASTSPPGMVGVPSDNVHANVPAHVDLPTSASAWSAQASDHAGDLEVTVATRSRASVGGASVDPLSPTADELVLEFSDSVNHEGREVAVDASTLVESVGYRPEAAYGYHEDGSRWTSPISYEDGSATWTIPKFSSNTVTFSGEVNITATPATDGSQYSYDLNDLDAADNFTIDVSGSTATEWDNESSVRVGPSSSQSISVAGNVAPNGPSANGNPMIDVSVPGLELRNDFQSASAFDGAQDVAINGSYAYVPSKSQDQLAIIDISNPDAPSVVSTLSGGALTNASRVAADGSYAYVATQDDTFAVVDVSTPSSPAVAGSVTDSTNLTKITEVVHDGSYVYGTSRSADQLTTIDVSSPSSPTVAGTVADSTTMDSPRGMDVAGSYAYVSGYQTNSLAVVDITDPTAPSVAGSVADSTALDGAWGVTADPSGSHVYVASLLGGNLTSVDVSTASSPTLADTLNVPMGSPREVTLHNPGTGGPYVYMAKNGDDQTVVENVSDPTALAHVDKIQKGTELNTQAGLAVGSESIWSMASGSNRLTALHQIEPVSGLSVSDDQTHSATLGWIEAGNTERAELAVNTSSTSLSWSGSGGTFDYTLELEEQTVSEDPTVEVNGQTTSYTGTLSDGSSTSLSTNTSWLQQGTNTVNVSVNTPSTDAPAGEVGLDYSHEAVDNQSVSYDAEAWSERYNVSKTYASDRTGATLDIPFQSSVIDVRVLEMRINGSTWNSVASSDYSLSGTDLTVNVGNVNAGTTVEVRTAGSKVNPVNGSISVTDPTVLEDDLATEFEITSYSSGFRIEVNNTAYGDSLHYTHSESYTGAESYARVESGGAQALYMPNAGAGDSAVMGTIPLEPQPSTGHVDVRVESAGSEPEFSVMSSTTSSDITFVWNDTVSGNTYQLYSLDADEERSRATASSPVDLLHDGTAETLKIFDLGTGGGGGGGGAAPAQVSGDSLPLTQPERLILVIGVVLAGLFVVSRRSGDSSITGKTVLFLAAPIAGVLAFSALAPERMVAEIALGLRENLSLILLFAGVALYLWYRQRKAPDTRVSFNLRGRR